MSLPGYSPSIAMAQDQIGCEYDFTMGSVRCVIAQGPLAINDIAINDGKCPVWDHRLVRASIDGELRANGAITTQGEYSADEVELVSEAVIDSIRQKPFARGSFFRFEAYRCVVKTISLDTSAGRLTFHTQQ
jgi:hypothetical protein